MRRFHKPAGALAIATATLALAACGGHGPNSYLMAKDPLQAKLTNSAKTFQSLTGQNFDVRALSWQGDRLQVSIKGPSGKATRCEAVVEAIDEEWTRVSPDCTKAGEEKTEQMLAEMQVDEFIIAVLYSKEMDNSMIAKRTSAIVLDTMDDIQRRAASDIEEASKAAESAAFNGESWAETGDGSDWGN